MTFTLNGPAALTEEIRKSCFTVNAAPVDTTEQAEAFIKKISDSTATHNCWAWKLGSVYRFHDDGEPGGTAGRPILAAIEGQDYDQIVVVVTRWFGGIKLGTGGLARAYGGSTARCLQAAERIELIVRIRFAFHCAYSTWPILQARLPDLAAIIEQQQFDAEGTWLQIALPRENDSKLDRLLADLTRGQTQLERID